MIGEQFLVGDEICGAVCSIRNQEDIVSLWNRFVFFILALLLFFVTVTTVLYPVAGIICHGNQVMVALDDLEMLAHTFFERFNVEKTLFDIFILVLFNGTSKHPVSKL